MILVSTLAQPGRPNSRANSIFMQQCMITSTSAARASAAAVSLTMPSLHLQHLGTDVGCGAGERRNIAGETEAVDDVDGFGNVLECLVEALPEPLLVPRIDRDDAMAVVEEGYFAEK